MANNYYRPLYTSFQQALEKFTSNTSSVQEISFSGSILIIYDLTEQFRIKAYVYLNNFINPAGSVTVGLNNFSSQIAVSDMKFYGSNNLNFSAGWFQAYFGLPPAESPDRLAPGDRSNARWFRVFGLSCR